MFSSIWLVVIWFAMTVPMMMATACLPYDFVLMLGGPMMMAVIVQRMPDESGNRIEGRQTQRGQFQTDWLHSETNEGELEVEAALPKPQRNLLSLPIMQLDCKYDTVSCLTKSK